MSEQEDASDAAEGPLRPAWHGSERNHTGGVGEEWTAIPGLLSGPPRRAPLRPLPRPPPLDAPGLLLPLRRAPRRRRSPQPMLNCMSSRGGPWGQACAPAGGAAPAGAAAPRGPPAGSATCTASSMPSTPSPSCSPAADVENVDVDLRPLRLRRLTSRPSGPSRRRLPSRRRRARRRPPAKQRTQALQQAAQPRLLLLAAAAAAAAAAARQPSRASVLGWEAQPLRRRRRRRGAPACWLPAASRSGAVRAEPAAQAVAAPTAHRAAAARQPCLPARAPGSAAQSRSA